MKPADTLAEEGSAPYVAFDEFRSGLPLGRFHLIVNPERARHYVKQRLNVLPLTVVLVGVGIALVLSGSVAFGAVLVFGGVIVKRLIGWQAPKILLHLASRQPAVYAEVTEQAILEVRRVG